MCKMVNYARTVVFISSSSAVFDFILTDNSGETRIWKDKTVSFIGHVSSATHLQGSDRPVS